MRVCFWGGLKTWKLECSNESPGQQTASDGASHARRATGLAETAGAGRKVSSETVATENPRGRRYLEQGHLQETFPRFNNMYCCTSIYIFDGILGENEK